MWQRSIFVFHLVALGACGFSSSVGSDAIVEPRITVGFGTAMSLADEKSADLAIPVRLSEASDTEITVKYAVAGGTALPIDDFDVISPETLTFAPGVIEVMLLIKVKADTDETEGNETILLDLAEPVGAKLDAGALHHMVTINARLLPRISFSGPSSNAEEPIDAVLDVVLDEASEFEITVDYVIEAAPMTTATAADFTLAAGQLTFAPGETTQPINLDVLDDALDEDDETVAVTLTTSTNAIVLDSAKTHVHTILDGIDPMPTVDFSQPSATFAEADGTVNIVVRLNAVSGRDVTVPFTLDTAGSTALGGGTDFTINTATPLVIAAGLTTANVSIAINQDAIDEPTESFKLDLGTPTNATLGTNTSHTASITDDDLVCYGVANSASDVCFDSPPTGTINLGGGNINTNVTGASAVCGNQPVGWAPMQDAACVVAAADITITGATTVTGSRPLILVAANSITINNILDGAGHQGTGTAGPGAPSGSCVNGTNPQNNATGAGGGAGGSFMSRGGNGGSGENGNANGGTSALADAAAPTKLRGGCNGQKGGNGGGGSGGRGGGAIYIISGNTIDFGANAVVNVSGAGGNGGGTNDGGGGGGAGGMIHIFATGTLTTAATTKLVSNGGGGGSGGNNGSGGSAGSDPVPQTETTAAGGGSGGGAGGGPGFAGVTQATAGNNGGNNIGGGGGGGAGGYILSNKALGTAGVSAGVVSVP